MATTASAYTHAHDNASDAGCTIDTLYMAGLTHSTLRNHIDACLRNAYTHDMEIADVALIYQDHYLLIVNKPAGLVIHPTYKHSDGTLWDAILAYVEQQDGDNWQPAELPDDPQWAGAPPEIREMLRRQRTDRLWREDGWLPRPCLVHRLDKDTSGIVALARTDRSRKHLIKQFHDHSIQKRYLAVIQRGAPEWAQPRAAFSILQRSPDGTERLVDGTYFFSASPEDEFILDGALQRDPAERRRCIVGPEGQQSQTSLRVLGIEEPYALLDVRPITGRTHQIRAHLTASGNAIVGDQMYARPEQQQNASNLLARQFLHAYSLTLKRYPSNEPATYIATLPADIRDWLQRTCPQLWQAWLDIT
ncbi:RluA family pseudouridine synthase [Dictyobacter arantiisoli]|uniref:RNA pseudouridylate synthase n=1 Tax=Dictyobacter arantiisoli TaxID=2014874 RepID=A0A5A5TJ78_9CHLR|nr:RNA pseudouridine synthase [Dictyobacter arantiisoli]GCF11053.1 hypothetical protein KDI_46170 [Dictyobacter arantiisoli]